MATKDISVIRDKKTGDIKNIRDKEIKDAKAKTAVAQTDAVRMKTVDDKEVYIDRNSLVQAIAEVMNSNSQSTIQTLFGADANGNHANINMANLASVLSDSKRFLTWVDYETPAGTFLCNYGQETSGVPNTAQAILTVNAVTWAGKFFKSMTYMTISTNKVFMKTFSSDKLYGDWIEIK